MNIKFENITIHHFLSIGDATLTLNDRGYVLVSGVNNNPKDLALSNGSGKSTIWSAICWALTGETIQGLTTNIPNLYYNDGCWVEISFDIDGNKYRIMRSRADALLGTDLKIFINNEDKSGKGIRESESLLKQYLPDLTSELIGSVIILGQGLPHKFSNNTPAGRKEVLEKLSKSDFMIQDIKDRLARRDTQLKTSLRTKEDEILKLTTTLQLNKSDLLRTENELKSLIDDVDYTTKLAELNSSLDEYKLQHQTIAYNIYNIDVDVKTITDNISALSEQKLSELKKVRAVYDDVLNDIRATIVQLESEKKYKDAELRKLKSIKDVCPTCGQKLPDVVKPETSNIESEINAISVKLMDHSINLSKMKDKLSEEESSVSLKYDSTLNEYKEALTKAQNERYDSDTQLTGLNAVISTIGKDIARIEALILSREQSISNLTSRIDELKNSILSLEDKILYNNRDKDNLKEHIDVISKMNTLVKRDFRGFLLTNVIAFIDSKAKEYCKEVFETEDIEFKLEGNNINITYSNKAYENLSGGEKQKVDLILQFALRDMLCQYLDFSSNILVLDEIFDNLDSIGCGKILDLISKKLIDIESVFIITHHDFDLSIPADSEIVIEKDINGISRIK